MIYFCRGETKNLLAVMLFASFGETHTVIETGVKISVEEKRISFYNFRIRTKKQIYSDIK